MPEARQNLLTRAREIGVDGVMGGDHVPSDILAGRMMGQAIARTLLAVPGFRLELDAVRAELSAVPPPAVAP